MLNDAVSIYFADATLASAFVARWCAGYKAETADGVFRVRTDEPGAMSPRTPDPFASACSSFESLKGTV
jgi:hypothetical protein